MWLFAGLGNIGREYAGTRHNVGFEVVDRVERDLTRSTGWRAGKGDYYVAKGAHAGEDVLLIKPTTYMNLSGRAVRDALQFYKCDISNLVVIVDDIALPLGTLRLRLLGSDGGHNGLSSIIYELGTNDFARLRCGIGGEFRKGDQVRHVLSQFKPDELQRASEMIDRAAGACERIVASGLSMAMNVINVNDATQA
ncbi:MAG: aminoacyl-tRNA hydrolase [Bacteroidota bacterium]|nr:aminoacyl-tRNA hydrolase [Bacteroidota bacterium]MDP4232823.1 aminoacyl-tRNA hydrolase [Bacteroidota bacterium]MDP4242496.1 aminoacyl-tRNA hydrolase [Bacteroidota bacterium]MDP4289026.1 aminoacyl-tRNA hydrolase [Bacteroidota bacterium]